MLYMDNLCNKMMNVYNIICVLLIYLFCIESYLLLMCFLKLAIIIIITIHMKMIINYTNFPYPYHY